MKKSEAADAFMAKFSGALVSKLGGEDFKKKVRQALKKDGEIKK